jgi:non-specific serine/threonine protein kinase
MDRLAVDQANHRAALAWLADSGQWLDCLRLAAALGRFWDHKGHLIEGRDWLERSLDRTRTADAPPQLRATALDHLGFIVLRLGDYDRAEACGVEERDIWLRLGDMARFAHAVYLLGAVAEYRGDDDLAETRYEEALVAYREVRHVAGIAVILENLGDAAYRRGDYARALMLSEEAVVNNQETFDAAVTAISLVGVAQAAIALGDGERAVAALRRSLNQSRDADVSIGMADALAGFASLAVGSGDPDRAARLLGAVETMLAELGAPRLYHHAMHQRTITAAREAMSESAFVTALAAGQALTPEQAVAEALAPLPPTPHPTDLPEVSGGAPRLTRRESQILRLLATGLTDPQIADTLFIGERTVNSHVARLYRKLGVHSRVAAIAAGIAAGLIDPPSQPTSPPRE